MTSPPRLARWLIGRLVRSHDRSFVVGDLDEEFASREATLGHAAARRWYWRQAARSAFPLAWHRVTMPPAVNPEPRPVAMWPDLRDDLRYALRLSGRNRLATVAVIGTMMLGIGATTAVFSVVNSVLLKPLPFPESERVVRLGMTLRDGRLVTNVAYPDLEDYRSAATSFSAFSGVLLSGLTLTEGDIPRQLLVSYVDKGYPNVFAARPTIGRMFTADEFTYGAPKVVVLMHAFWQRQFGGDRSIVGRTVSLGNEPYIVIGILAPLAYTYPYPGLDLVAPLRLTPGSYQTNRGALWLRGAGKLKPGVSVEQGQRELSAIADRIAKEYPEANGGIGVRVESLHDVEVGEVRAMLMLLAASVAAVLPIACVNIANVILGQSFARAREFAVRAALGGSGGRIRRQLLTESLALATVGGFLGAALSPFITRALIALYPGRLPRVDEVAVDLRVLAVAAIATILAGLMAGIPMARRAAALNLTRDLRSGARAGSAGQRNANTILVGSQVALSLALLFSAGLLLRTFQALSHTDPGFVSRDVASFELQASRARYEPGAPVAGYFAAVERAISALPGVQSVAMASEVPYNMNNSWDVFVDRQHGDLGHENPQVRIATVSPSYWATLGVRLIRGRSFTQADNEAAPKVVVVNEALVRRFYPAEDPVGRVIQWNREDWQIVGVVGSMRMKTMVDPSEPELYTTFGQVADRGRFVLVKSSVPAEQLLSQIRTAIRTIDPTIAMTSIATMEERVREAVAPQRFRAALIGGLALLALLLSTLGVYGVVAYAVSRQTRDIGIRMALGEDRGAVRRRVVLDALRIAGFGAAAGVLLALAVSQWLSAFIVGVRPRDPLMLGAACVILLGVATLAAYFPARRASRIDPLSALRGD
ncbi:MAG: ADOP family duplicated permease [Gemmatimonadaceae bacterium]